MDGWGWFFVWVIIVGFCMHKCSNGEYPPIEKTNIEIIYEIEVANA
jgi:hypothetical protein